MNLGNFQNLETPWGPLLLGLPDNMAGEFRAWDAADELILGCFKDLEPLCGSVLEPEQVRWVLNDAWGSLGASLGLAGSTPQWVQDSCLAQQVYAEQLAQNSIAGSGSLQSSFVSSDRKGEPQEGVALLKIPKSLDLLKTQLAQLGVDLEPGSLVVAGAMVKHLPTTALTVFEQLIGPSQLSRAHKKARLIVARVERPRPAPTPRAAAFKQFEDPRVGFPVAIAAGVFGGARLDPGTALLLQALSAVPALATPHSRVVDLGSGNGVIGAWCAVRSPDAEVALIDDSAQAVAASAETIALALGASHTRAQAMWGSELGALESHLGWAPGSVDLIVTNPPFHLGHSVSDETAWRMFVDSHRVLRDGGQLWVVGNRHLGYHAKLRRLFGNVENVASDPKFVVLCATR